ncbi:MAG TPA: hypothetical protein VNF99_04720 [Stellaceae bacterium]|nr:hypothetical protein [Stellaceae bacterium]
MPLISLWESNPTAISQFAIEQVVATAGSGILKDGSDCSQELRAYLVRVPITKLSEYVDGCLTRQFSNSGLVLQDLVNEIGRRLDYKVANGRYRGVVNAIGNDGIWISPEGHSLILEVKTTDAYRISLDKIAEYREKQLAAQQISAPSSVLIVVGRQDTGELEAQIRGSRHAWDMRLISVEALINLVLLKENSEEVGTGTKIRSLLVPMEYTRLDRLIDVMFTTAKDVEKSAEAETRDEVEPPEQDASGKIKGVWKFTDPQLLQGQRERIVAALAARERVGLIRKSRALYWDPSHVIRAAITVSKVYERGNSGYWYAYHPQWDEFLTQGERGYLVLGCMDLDKAFAIPLDTVHENLDALNTTETDKGEYWHVFVNKSENGKFVWLLSKRRSTLDLSLYELSLPSTNTSK